VLLKRTILPALVATAFLAATAAASPPPSDNLLQNPDAVASALKIMRLQPPDGARKALLVAALGH